jgi:hypothetical protein
LGPSLGERLRSSPPPQVALGSTIATPNPFTALDIEPQYSPLAYIDVDIKPVDTGEWRPARAMIDCGGQGSFINAKLSQNYQLPLQSKPFPISLILADGSPSQTGSIVQYNPLLLRAAGNEERLSLDVAPISHDIILGMPWLRRHDPSIRFGSNQILFDSPYCERNCNHFGKTIPLHPVPPLPPTLEPVTPDPEPPRKQPVATGLVLEPREASGRGGVLPETRGGPRISTVGAHTFALLCNQPSTQLFTMSFSHQARGLSSATIMATDQEPGLSLVPPEYQEFTDLFSEKEAKKLPPHRPYDHQIPLEPGTTPPFGTIYSLSPTELETLRKYIEENLSKGFIRHSQSPCGAPVLFVKKPDGGLRLCVDYRGLNKITTKNRYPLPLIGELLDRISRAKYFTKMDVRDGYYRLRIAPGEEWKTAFRCRYGLFEYTVMPFGLCNAPGTFQHYMNDTFRGFLDQFLIIYLDDLLIYSDTLTEHKRHVRMVLEKLREADLCLKPSKCQFHVQEVPFLGFIVGPQGVRMDPEKVEAITSWPVPRSIHDIRVFLGLANFYRRFILNFSKAAAPITALLRKNRRFQWTPEAQSAFESLRTAFTTAPILRHFDPALPAVLETDASDYAIGAIISQRDPDSGRLHPITFHSRKFNSAELNYEIYDKEMLAIVESMDRYRHYFEGLGQTTTIFSDHRNLLWFTETKVYNRRQARWAEKLSRFNFKIVFRPGKQGGKPDALSRRPDFTLGDDTRERTMTFLKPEQVDISLLPTDDPVLATYALATTSHSAITAITTVGEIGPDGARSIAIREALERDGDVGHLLPYLRDPAAPHDEAISEALQPFGLDEEGILLRNGLTYIPADDALKLDLLRECHDAPMAGHLGREKTLELLSRNYYWPGMRSFVNEYVRTCDTCARNKTSRHAPYGPLHPLPIPPGPWKSVSMDFIVELPPSDGHDAIYVCVDRFTKMAHFIPTTTAITAEGTAQLYYRHVWKHHGLPADIVSDWGPQFVSRFTRHLLTRLGVQGNRSTAFHPQSDGQTERVNQTLEQYLRIYCGYHQDDWAQLLPLAEFVYNNAQNASTKVSPFFANYGYHPRCSVTISSEAANPAAAGLVDKLQAVHSELKEQLQTAQERYKNYHDRRRVPVPPFAVGDKVWLSRRNIRTTRPSQKLDVKRMGPFRILEIVGDGKPAYRLELPAQMGQIHPVFHASLLEPHHENPWEGRIQTPPPPQEVEGELEYEVEAILDSKLTRGKLMYLVDWVGYGQEERTWEPAENVEHAEQAVADFHRAHPERPSRRDLPARRQRSAPNRLQRSTPNRLQRSTPNRLQRSAPNRLQRSAPNRLQGSAPNRLQRPRQSASAGASA